MGTGDESTKTASSTQELPTTLAYPDWSNSMQAFYGAAGATPPPFFASTVASPTPHPYMWGSQHHLMPPYGTPVPYPAMYPPGGVYAHPSMATTPSIAPTNTVMETKGPEVKDRTSAKKSKGISGGKAGEMRKATTGSGNDGVSQSAESGSEGSSEASDENGNQQDFAGSKKRSFDQMLAEANAQSNMEAVQASVPGKPVASMAATNLNIGMELWNPSSSAAGAAKMRPNPSRSSTAVAPAMNDQWGQDERELKRQKRKQSNRDSARRSRLRKQAECEELQGRVETLNSENSSLRDELQRLSEECEKLSSENNSIKEELTQLCGPEVLANLEQSNPPASVLHSRGGKGSS